MNGENMGKISVYNIRWEWPVKSKDKISSYAVGRGSNKMLKRRWQNWLKFERK